MVVLGSHMDDVRKFPCAAKKAAKVFFAAGGMFLVVSTWDQIRKKTFLKSPDTTLCDGEVVTLLQRWSMWAALCPV